MSWEVTGADPRARALFVKGPSVTSTNKGSRPHGATCVCGGVEEGRRRWIEADKRRERLPPVTEEEAGGAGGSHVHRGRKTTAFLIPT